MISVLFKELEHKVEKLKNKKAGGHAAEEPASKLSVTLWRQGGNGKKSLQQCLWNLNIPIKKADVKCWLAEMTLVMTPLPLAHVCLHSHSFPLCADWRKSDSSVKGELQGNWRWISNSWDIVVSFPSFSHPTARGPRRACSQASSWGSNWIWTSSW